MGICDCETHQNVINIPENIETPIPNQLIIQEKSKNNENNENVEEKIIKEKIFENFELKNSIEAYYDIITCLIELHN